MKSMEARGAIEGTAGAMEGALTAQLGAASKIIVDRLQRDERVGEQLVLDNTLQGNASSDYVLSPNATWLPMVKQRTIPYPEDMLNELNYTSSRTMMGIFPEIDRAWMTQDSRLWLWDYLNPAIYDSCDFVQDVIISIALSKPIPGVFTEKIHYVLILCTPQHVSLVGLSSTSTAQGPTIEGHYTDLEAKTDGVLFTLVAAHNPTGRIFLSGNATEDQARRHGGDLYELQYSQRDGWFSGKIRLVNHSRGGAGVGALLPSWITAGGGPGITALCVDDIRHILYVTTAGGALKMYGLGADGKAAPTEIASVPNVLRQAQVLCPAAGTLLDSRNSEIVGMNVIKKGEGGSIALVATTQAGVRLYFSHTRRGYGYYPQSYNSSYQSGSSAYLGLTHVRLPPRPPQQPATSNGPTSFGIQPSSSAVASSADTHVFSNIAFAHYVSPSGFFFAANAVPGAPHEEDVLLVCAPDIGRTALNVAIGQPASVTEVAGTVALEGRTKGLAEVTRSRADGPVMGTELATQLSEGQRLWVAVTSGGLHVLARQRPVDVLAEILEGLSGREHELTQFWENFGRDQACAMCVCISASQGTLSTSRVSAGMPSIARHGGSEAAAQARRLFYELSGKPEAVGQAYNTGSLTSPPPGPAVSVDNKVVFSGRHEGIALYLARLLQPIWKLNITRPDLQNPALQVSNVPEPTLVNVQTELVKLKTFTDTNHALLSVPPDGRSGIADQSALAVEQASLATLQDLLTQAIEAISFLLLLIDYRFSDIIASTPSDVNKAIKNLSFCDFLTTVKGRTLARALVRALINHQISQSLSVDAISETLQQRCGSFCSSDDVFLYKAIEALNRATETTAVQERWEGLHESLRLFNKAAKHVSEEQLQTTCATYNDLLFTEGTINLAIACAAAWDPQNIALEYWEEGQPTNDPRKSQYDTRQKCYAQALTALQAVDDILNESISLSEDRRLLPEDAELLWRSTREAALRSEDETFHYALYDWLLQDKADQLVDLRTSFLEKYLARDEGSLDKLDLLWRYYVQSGRRLDAARMLGNLAESTAFDIPVSRRCEFLSAAVANAKASPDLAGQDDGVFGFITDLEEKLDVSKVQIDIEGAVRDIPESDLPPDRRNGYLHVLQSRLLSITELYTDIAEPLGLLDATLYIFHVADHRDPEIIRETWEAILDRADRGAAGAASGVDSVASKVTELARRFYPSEAAFPLPMVINMLEAYALEHATERSNWVVPSLRAGRVPWQLIWEALDGIFISRSPPWHTIPHLLHLGSELTLLFDTWLQEAAQQRPMKNPELPVARIVDSIDGYLSALSGKTPAGYDRVVEQLLARFRTHQRLLQTQF